MTEMEQQPKNITKNFKFRNRPYGNDRRVMAAKAVVDKQPHFPKSVEYADIDQAVFDWVDQQIEITYSGQKLPTYKLFSTQRLAEYAQNWQNVDEKGNLNLNFKTITRETNPQHGDLAGNNYNIPGDREYIVFKTTEVEEKGDEVTQIYTMKQPFAVNLIYTVNIITSSYQILNEMNTKIQDLFKSLECYIFPNNHAMPMELNSVGDESDYTIDDRKYYAQSYQIKVMAYIIKEEDFKVRKVRSRLRNQFVVGQNSRNKTKKEKFDIGVLSDNENKFILEKINNGKCTETVQYQAKIEKNKEIEEEIYTEPEITIEEIEANQKCWEGTEYEITVNRKISYVVPITTLKPSLSFEIEQKLEVETLSLNNIKDYNIEINGTEINFEESDVTLRKGDIIKVTGVQKNPTKNGEVTIVCYDPDSIQEESKEIKL